MYDDTVEPRVSTVNLYSLPSRSACMPSYVPTATALHPLVPSSSQSNSHSHLFISLSLSLCSALVEKIVAALPRLKCPLRLEPHQIQGLDCIHIFPVVQWLVKKALETREELAVQQRNSALHEFDKHGVTPEDRAFNAQLVGSTASVLTVQAEYCANRQLKAPTLENADEETRVQCTLLEYGQRYGASKVAMAKKKDGDKVRRVPSHACMCACLVHVCSPRRMHATCADTLLRSCKHRFARLRER